MPLRKIHSARIALAGILLSDICSKTNPIFAKILFKDGWTPLSLYFLTLIFVVILLSLHEFMHTENKERWKINKKDLFGISITSVTGGILSPLLFMFGLLYVQVSEAVVINSLIPLFIVVLAVVFLKEKFTKQTVLGAIFLIAGTMVLLWRDILHAQLNPGVIMLVLAAFFSAVTTIFHKKYVTHRHLDFLVLIRAIMSLCVVFVLIFFLEPQTFAALKNPPGIWMVLGLSIIAYIIPYFLYFRSIRHVKSMDAGLVLTAGPVIGMLMAHVFLGEQLLSEHLISLTFIGIGIVFINVPLTRWRIMPWRLMAIGPLRR